MSKKYAALIQALSDKFAEDQIFGSGDELELRLPANQLLVAAVQLRDAPEFAFEQLIDICAVDYLHYGMDEWKTNPATSSGFSRAVNESASGRLRFGVADKAQPLSSPRFAVVYHLLSYKNNHRLRLKVFVTEDDAPIVPSIIDVWPVADWFEREAFDLYGVVFEGHPDLRRILSDYGFVGHPFRKDFPLIGNVEMRYDPEKKRVVYEPVTIEPRVLVPKVIRDDYPAPGNTKKATSGRDDHPASANINQATPEGGGDNA
jgi:NADH-quinone oxidoreductase subunit C